MEITEVRIKLMENSDDRLQAFCSITFDDCFVIRDLKIIEGANGPFVAMPSRKLTFHCPQCGAKNHLRSGYCNHCGGRLKDERPGRDSDGRTKLYADIAHPINSECREMIQSRVIAEFNAELDRAKQPGYVSRYDEGYPDDDAGDDSPPRDRPRAEVQPAETEPRPPHRPQTRAPQAGSGSATRSTPSGPHSRPDTAPESQDDDRGDSFGAGIFD